MHSFCGLVTPQPLGPNAVGKRFFNVDPETGKEADISGLCAGTRRAIVNCCASSK